MAIERYLRPSVSNGHPHEQALIRQWWHEIHGARGRIVWEYYLGDCYLDAMWFPDVAGHATEVSGLRAPTNYPIKGVSVVLCEAKLKLTLELIGQALVYGSIARRAGAKVQSVVIFAEQFQPSLAAAAQDLGLNLVLPQDVANA